MSEVLFMLLMPFFFVRLGVKKMLLVGMAAWVLRYVLFAFGDTDSNYWMLILGIVLHGICYDFFFVTGQIYTDNRAGDRFKSAAQGLITLATYGAGMFVGSVVSGYIVDMYANDGGHDWQSVWLIPAGIAVFILALFSLTFRDKAEGAKA
jgi:MFS family permease